MTEREVVFVGAMRTAFGRMGGTIRDIFASKLAGIGLTGLI
ncbi:MAG: acetyl-CoA C-acyltransferase, partial [Deltaproteobacteria bacterium]|nr:acetyl-CoA C-acyltransferase [Deltaproteobacteria bacterium]